MSVFTRFGPMAPGGASNPWKQAVGYVDGVPPTGNIDGVNTTYTLVNAERVAVAPNPAESLMLFADGMLCVQSTLANDASGDPMFTYTLSGSTVTFNNPLPSTVITLIAWYRYKVGG